MQPLVDTLAREFSKGLHAYLTEEQMQAVVERNRAEIAAGACHSHDFCDANSNSPTKAVLDGNYGLASTRWRSKPKATRQV